MTKTLDKEIEEVLELFDETFELHDVGKDEFTICRNNVGEDTCNGGVSIAKENLYEAEQHLKNLREFISSSIRKVVEESLKEVVEELGKEFFGKDWAENVLKEYLGETDCDYLPNDIHKLGATSEQMISCLLDKINSFVTEINDIKKKLNTKNT